MGEGKQFDWTLEGEVYKVTADTWIQNKKCVCTLVLLMK